MPFLQRAATNSRVGKRIRARPAGSAHQIGGKTRTATCRRARGRAPKNTCRHRPLRAHRSQAIRRFTRRIRASPCDASPAVSLTATASRSRQPASAEKRSSNGPCRNRRVSGTPNVARPIAWLFGAGQGAPLVMRRDASVHSRKRFEFPGTRQGTCRTRVCCARSRL
jgi:hypothetical protein